MSDWQVLADEINTIEYLYLRSVETTAGWGLRIIIDEIVPPRGPDNLERDFHPVLAARIQAELTVEPTRTPRAYEISFREAICYLVQNETYGVYPQPPEVFTGKFFRIFSKSHLLDLVQRTTYASEDHPGPEVPQHFSIACQDDVVDVIACMKPEIRQVATEGP